MSLTKASFSMIAGAPLNVLDFGADPTGTINSATAIQAAFDEYGNTAGTGKFVDVYFPIGTYLVNTELITNGANMIGESFDTIIKASTAIRSVIKMRGQQSRIENMTIDANNLANYGVYVGDDINGFGTNSGLITGCKIQYAKLDGVYFSNQGNHNNFVIDRSLIWFNGSSYSTGTATTTAGNNVATIAGAADLTTFVQPMYDYIHVTGEPLPLAIISVTANTVTTNPNFVANNAGQLYTIKQGSGVNVTSHGDNSEIKITNSILNLNQLAGLDDHALYGVESFNNVIESNGYFGRIIGRGGATPHFPISAGDFRNYYEGHTFGDIRFENGKDPVFDITGETNLSLISFNTSINGIAKGLKYIGNGENFDSNLYVNFNVASFTAEWGATHQLAQGGGVGNVIVNLPISASALETSFRTLMLSKITLLVYEMNGQNVIIKSASNNVNGVAGTTGATISGSFKKIECSFNGAQWIVG
jgi:hypothetical protein